MILRIGMAQINSWMGDFKHNTEKISAYIKLARENYCDIVVFPELSVSGYPPEDLVYKPDFLKENRRSLDFIRQVSDYIAVIAGFIEKGKKKTYNSAAIIYNKKLAGIYRKAILPNYGVFDEKRYFSSGEDFSLYDYKGVKFTVAICEDIWAKEGPLRPQVKAGSQIIFSINASPFYAGKMHARLALLRQQAKDNKVYIVYTNLVGGQDELVFDGRSVVIDKKGKVLAQAKSFEEDLRICDIDIDDLAKRRFDDRKVVKITAKPTEKPIIPVAKKLEEIKKVDSPQEEIYRALVLGLRDYVVKNGFKKVVVGLSGGVDSALVASLAVDALGKENVHAVFMPSQFSSEDSRQDAQALAQNLGIDLKVIPIQELFSKYMDALKEDFRQMPWNVAEENLQARIRGNILMALSNKFGWLVLTTGNKSEVSVGYCTLYGDAAGGFAPIKDVPKTTVYELARYRNSLGKQVIPERVFVKAPTAELRENQKDTDTLPPYDILDPILKAYVEEEKPLAKIISLCRDEKTARMVIEMVDKSEYKRRQSPPGIKITPKAFGRDRRMPITNRFRQA